MESIWKTNMSNEMGRIDSQTSVIDAAAPVGMTDQHYVRSHMIAVITAAGVDVDEVYGDMDMICAERVEGGGGSEGGGILVQQRHEDQGVAACGQYCRSFEGLYQRSYLDQR
jgi:hypothetical protein